MKSLLDVQNVRIRFKFIVIENEFNFFYIKYLDLGEYVYMKENGLCKYDKMFCVLEIVEWRIFFVCDRKQIRKKKIYFVLLCVLKSGQKNLFLLKNYFLSV